MCRKVKLVALFFAFVSSVGRAQWAVQEIVLEPGWNAVYLEVQPEPRDCELVFADLPIESVWAWNRRFSSVQFIQDATTLLPEQPEWLAYFPPISQEAFLTNLFIIRGGRAYLIKLGGSQSVEWVVTGRPVLRSIDWMANSFNLVGFHVDPNAPPTFESFFAPSTAHAGQPVYRLNMSGQWERIADPSRSITKSGEAYWVYCKGQSSYSGPLFVEFEQGHGMDFGRVLNEQTLLVKNSTDLNKQISIDRVASVLPPDEFLPPIAGNVPLSYWDVRVDPDTDPKLFGWTDLMNRWLVSVPARGEVSIRLAVRRKDMPPAPSPDSLYQSLLQISDGAGIQLSLPVTAKGMTYAGNVPLSSLSTMASRQTTTNQWAGLWVGMASVNKVSFPADPGDPNTPKPTASEFHMRLIVHVDAGGQAKLLQHVTLMWQEGTTRPDPEDPTKLVMDEPGRFVLIADDDFISQFSGAAIRDGELVARRISSAAFGISDPASMTGSFDGTLACSLTLNYDDPVNPFKHKYHPDHDNLDNDFATLRPEGKESYTIERDIQLAFTAEDPEGLDLPGWGDNQVGGVYRERIRGVHKNELVVEGTFRLHHASRVPVLNDGL